MSKIILPNGNGTGPRSLKRGSDFVTMDEIVKLLGPLAQMSVEMHHRLEDLEAQHGIFPAIESDTEGPNVSGDMD